MEVPKQSPTLPDHHEQTSPAMMILLVDLQMLGEVIDTLSQQRNLDLRRACVRGMRAKFIYNSLRVVHEVLSYASKWSGECPREMIARLRCTDASNLLTDEDRYPRSA